MRGAAGSRGGWTTREYAVVIGLAVVIVGTVVISVFALLDGDIPTGETTGRQRFHCLECEHEFFLGEAYPDLMSSEGFGPTTRLDCPKCEAKGAAVLMLECPDCGTWFVSEQARRGIPAGNGRRRAGNLPEVQDRLSPVVQEKALT